MGAAIPMLDRWPAARDARTAVLYREIARSASVALGEAIAVCRQRVGVAIDRDGDADRGLNRGRAVELGAVLPAGEIALDDAVGVDAGGAGIAADAERRAERGRHRGRAVGLAEAGRAAAAADVALMEGVVVERQAARGAALGEGIAGRILVGGSRIELARGSRGGERRGKQESQDSGEQGETVRGVCSFLRELVRPMPRAALRPYSFANSAAVNQPSTDH